MKHLNLILLSLALLLAACGDIYRDRSVEMTTVNSVDLQRYQGRWYEIARYPNFFERGCVGVTATYGLREDGRIDVRNACRANTLDGDLKVAEGIARVEGPGKLGVTFTPWLPGVWGDYWVLHLEPDYSVVVVGSPGGRVGWILARSPELEGPALARSQKALVRNGYDLGGLEYPIQVAAN
jgi:apolipoprotein D and lipocalin family protein